LAQDARLARMLHVLLHISLHKGAATSQSIARLLGTNPVVVRRTLAGLRDRGYVTATKGPGGGWNIARPLDQITIRDVHEAIGAPESLTCGLAHDHPQCPVERAVNKTLEQAFAEAEMLLLSRFADVTLADIAVIVAQ
jgi:Rrf2 family protein